MALEDLYGIGKGEAQIFDNRPVLNLLAEERQVNRRNNAEKLAKKATKAAALNALDDKLKNEGWDRHNQYLQEKLDGLKSYASNLYGEHGEEVFAENPVLAKEWKGKIDDFVKWNSWSKNMKANAQKQLERSAGNQDELDVESAGEFNKWLELSPEEQYTTPMPLIRDRELDLNEVIGKNYSTEIANLAKDFGGSTIPDDGGVYKTYSGTTIEEPKLNNLVDTIASNPNSQAYRTAQREAAQEINTELLSPTTIDEQGNEIDNQTYIEALQKAIKDKIKEQVVINLPKKAYKEQLRFKPGSGSNKEVPLEVTEVDPNEAGFIKEELPEILKKSGMISSIYSDNTGKSYYKIQKPLYVSPDGKATTDSKDSRITNEWIKYEIGDVLDKSFNQKADTGDLTEQKGFKKEPVSREYAIKTPEKATVKVDYYIKDDGTKEKLPEGTVFDGATIVRYQEGKANDTENELTFAKEGKENVEVVTLKTKKGTYVVPYTGDVKKQFPKVQEQIEAKKPKTKKEIKSSDIAAKAKAAGYSTKEYTQLLKDNGVNIID